MLIFGFRIAEADALQVRDSLPASDAIIHGRHAEYVIRFDQPVDHTTSRMELMQSGQVIRTLTPLRDSAPNVLFASGETPPPGHYTLHWQVRSPEERTVIEGDIPFSVEE
jgi:methionine-rich copper-binding protein CopC